jgi:trk system potassium uptake protein TrkH
MKRWEHLAMIAHDMGIVFQYLGLTTLIPLLVLAYFQEWRLFLPMAMVPAVYFILGKVIARIPRSEHVPHLSVALVGVAITWFVVALIGAIPFVFGMHMSFTDSFFEAISGWTGTGLTMMQGLDTAPRTILFWRSFTEWFGSIGVIAFGIAVQSKSGLAQFRLYRSEGRSEAIMPSIVSTARRMWVIYLTLTGLFTLLIFTFTGITFWDALNLVMVAIATGGFTMYDAGILHYNNVLLEALLIPVMVAGALPFKLYFLLYRGRILPILKDSTVQVIVLLGIIGSLFVSMELYIFDRFTLTDAIRQGFFSTISGFTTTGLQNTSFHSWVPTALIVVILLMMVGGASGSTAGGIKANRVVLAYSGVAWWFKRYFVRGNVVVPFKYEGRVIPKKVSDLEISKNMLIVILYFLTIAFATIVVLHFPTGNFVAPEVVFELVSAMSNVGLSTGFLSPTSPLLVKWIGILLMWVGRLEIVPVIILIMGLAKGFESEVVK